MYRRFEAAICHVSHRFSHCCSPAKTTPRHHKTPLWHRLPYPPRRKTPTSAPLHTSSKYHDAKLADTPRSVQRLQQACSEPLGTSTSRRISPCQQGLHRVFNADNHPSHRKTKRKTKQHYKQNIAACTVLASGAALHQTPTYILYDKIRQGQQCMIQPVLQEYVTHF